MCEGGGENTKDQMTMQDAFLFPLAWILESASRKISNTFLMREARGENRNHLFSLVLNFRRQQIS